MAMQTQDEILVLLAEARKAYHQLMTGTMLVELRDQNGENVRFTAARKADLYAYIQQLEALVCPTAMGRNSNKPMGFIF